MIIGSGRFEGQGGHRMEGGFQLLSTPRGVLFETSEDFYFDGSPAPGWALGKDGIYTVESALAGEIFRIPISAQASDGSVKGIQRGIVPKMHNIQRFDAIFLWCFEFPFLLGLGKIIFNSGENKSGGNFV